MSSGPRRHARVLTDLFCCGGSMVFVGHTLNDNVETWAHRCVCCAHGCAGSTALLTASLQVYTRQWHQGPGGDAFADLPPVGTEAMGRQASTSSGKGTTRGDVRNGGPRVRVGSVELQASVRQGEDSTGTAPTLLPRNAGWHAELSAWPPQGLELMQQQCGVSLQQFGKMIDNMREVRLHAVPCPRTATFTCATPTSERMPWKAWVRGRVGMCACVGCPCLWRAHNSTTVAEDQLLLDAVRFVGFSAYAIVDMATMFSVSETMTHRGTCC